MVYRDQTFCPFWKECKNGDTCFRAFKPKDEEYVKKNNELVSWFMDKPDCFVEIKKV